MKRAPAVPMKVSLTSPLAGEVGGEAAGWGRSSLRNLGEWNRGLLAEVAVVQLRDALAGVDLVHRLVVSDAHDPRKPQRVAAEVATGMLDGIEGDLQHHLRPHQPGVSHVADGDF